MRKTFSSKKVYQTLIDLRKGYLKDLRDMKNPDETAKLIIHAKVVAIGQALDEFGYTEPDVLDVNEERKEE